MLSLSEELLLLALDDEKGTIHGSAQQSVKFGLAAAGVVDLLLSGALMMGEKTRLSAVDSPLTGDDILDEILAQIQGSKKQRSVGDWVGRFGNGGIKKLQERLESRLMDRGVLRHEEGRFLKIFPWHHYPTLEGAPEAEAKERLRRVLQEEADPDARTAILISLVKTCGLLDRVFSTFPKEERKRMDKRAREIAKGEFAGEAVSKAVQEAAAATAAMIAAMSAATAASSSSSSS